MLFVRRCAARTAATADHSNGGEPVCRWPRLSLRWLRVQRRLQHRLHDCVLVRKDAEYRSFSYPGRLRDLAGGHVGTAFQ